MEDGRGAISPASLLRRPRILNVSRISFRTKAESGYRCDNFNVAIATVYNDMIPGNVTSPFFGSLARAISRAIDMTLTRAKYAGVHVKSWPSSIWSSNPSLN
jgi:hypothetical protein